MAKMSKVKGERVSRRDNFTKSVIEILYKRAGGRCCRCSAATFGPVTNNPDKWRNIGQAAHIAAAAPLGPRYDPKMNAEQRTSASNGMWLCSNCHDVIDRDVAEFTTKVLKEMKKIGEEKAKKEIGVAREGPVQGRASSRDTFSACVSASAIVEIRKARTELAKYHGHSLTRDEGESFLELVGFIDFSQDPYLPEVESEMIPYLGKVALYCEDKEIAMEVVRRMKLIADACLSHWKKEDITQLTDTVKFIAEKFSSRGRMRTSIVSQSSVALLKDMSCNKTLTKKKLSYIAREAMRAIGGRDETDFHPPPTKRSKGEEEEEEEEEREETKYRDAMQRLAETADVEQALELESQLAELGYETNVV